MSCDAEPTPDGELQEEVEEVVDAVATRELRSPSASSN